MDYAGWPQPTENPNPTVDLTYWYTAGSYYNLNADPYQLPNIYPHNGLYPPQPQAQPLPPGVDPAYVPPAVAVTYSDQTISYLPQQSVAAAYYPDANARWAASVRLYGSTPTPTPNIAGVATPNPAIAMPNPVIQSQKRNTKKKGLKKLKVVQSAWCEVCKVDCNSEDVLDQHKLGKKHMKNLEKLKWTTVLGASIAAALPCALATSQAIVAPPVASQAVVAPPVASQAIVASTPAATGTLHSQAIVAATPVASVTSQAIVATLVACTATTSGPIRCALPSAAATSPAVIATVPAMEAASTNLPVSASAPINKPIIGPVENPQKPKASNSKKARKKAAARSNDLETKRRKVLEGGAVADSVRACSICNVVCNSDIVFNFHVAGQKHASMVKKLASSG